MSSKPQSGKKRALEDDQSGDKPRRTNPFLKSPFSDSSFDIIPEEDNPPRRVSCIEHISVDSEPEDSAIEQLHSSKANGPGTPTGGTSFRTGRVVEITKEASANKPSIASFCGHRQPGSSTSALPRIMPGFTRSSVVKGMKSKEDRMARSLGLAIAASTTAPKQHSSSSVASSFFCERQFSLEEWYCANVKYNHQHQYKFYLGPGNVLSFRPHKEAISHPLVLIPTDIKHFEVAEPFKAEDTTQFLPVIRIALTDTCAQSTSWKTLGSGSHPWLLVIYDTLDEMGWRELVDHLALFIPKMTLTWPAMRALIKQTRSGSTLAGLPQRLQPDTVQPVRKSKAKCIPEVVLPTMSAPLDNTVRARAVESINTNAQPMRRSPNTTNPGAWWALKGLELQNTHSNRINLKRAFYTLQHDPNRPIGEFIDSLTTLANQLKTLEVSLTDDELIDVILYALHDDWSDVSKALLKSEAQLDLARVIRKLIEEEARRKGGPV